MKKPRIERVMRQGAPEDRFVGAKGSGVHHRLDILKMSACGVGCTISEPRFTVEPAPGTRLCKLCKAKGV